MSSETIQLHTWVGYEKPYLASPNISTCGSMLVGCYGGNKSAGAIKNEDAVWCLVGETWQLGIIFDAHNSSESAVYLVDLFSTFQLKFEQIMSEKLPYAFSQLQQFIIKLLGEQEFKNIQGETSILICAHKDGFLWWFCIGDNLACLLHPELIQFGQYALNQRSFYEWVGEANTFALPVACYSSGIRELRQGKNIIVMVTDGLLEFGSRSFENSTYFYNHFTRPKHLRKAVQSALDSVHTTQGKDSATIVVWTVDNNRTVTYPTG